MIARDIVVIGGSAGGIPALLELARGLPRTLPAALFVAVHSSPDSPGLLPELLARAGPLPAAHAREGERIRRGRFYVAPPDRHVLVDQGVVRVTRGPKENGFRPAIDPLFRTAAGSCGARVVGVVLSGALNDGADGLQIIKRRGGVAIAQDQDDALVPGMPLSAMLAVDVDHVLPVRDMPAVITRLATEPAPGGRHAMSRRDARKDTAAEIPSLHEETPRGPLAPFTCTECGGALWETESGKLVRFDCHVGHRFTAESLMAGQDRSIEAAMWKALRALEEKSALRRRMAERARAGRLTAVAESYEKHAAESEAQADVIRRVLVEGREGAAAAGPEAGARRRSSGRRSGGLGERRAAGRRARR